MTGLWPGPDWFLEPGWDWARWWLNSGWKNETCASSCSHSGWPGPHHGLFAVGRSTLSHNVSLLRDPTSLFLIPVPAPLPFLMPSRKVSG